MKWNEAKDVKGLIGAEITLVSGDFALALWNHSKCKGWNLYYYSAHQVKRWIATPPMVSLTWSKFKAMRWANKTIHKLDTGGD